MDMNLYCDESCHGLGDGEKTMVLGALSCPFEDVREVSTRLRELKVRYKLSPRTELKWGKVSPSKEAYYTSVLNFFLRHESLRYRGVIVPDKTILKHEEFDQSHDEWYYKMFFTTLKVLFHSENKYNIYLDFKDTHSPERARKLHEILCRNIRDFKSEIIRKVEPVRSHQVEQIQLVDFVTGIVSYANRGLDSSPTKIKLVNTLRKITGYSLTENTPLRPPEAKLNLLRWVPREH